MSEKDLPKKSSSKNKGNSGESLFEAVFEMFSNPVDVSDENDMGIDFLCKLIDEETGEINPEALFNIQVKTTEEVEIKKGKLRAKGCKVGNVKYWLRTSGPSFIVIVDRKEKEFYWGYPREILENYDRDWKSQNTVTIKIPESQKFDINTTSLPSKMERIILKDHPNNLSREIKKIRNDKKDAKRKLEGTELGEESEVYIELHKFLDVFNYELSVNFPIVKRYFYGADTWQTGLAYDKINDQSIKYFTYSISADENDVQIKNFNADLDKDIVHLEPGILNEDKRDTALYLIRNKLNKLFNSKSLRMSSDLIKKEFLFSLIYEINEALGLEQKDKYRTDVLREAFSHHLLLWVDTALKEVDPFVGTEGYYDPEMLLSHVFGEDLKIVNDIVEERIENGDDIPELNIGSERYPFGVAFRYLSDLAKENKEIERPPTVMKDENQEAGYIWSGFEKEQVKELVETVFHNLPKIHDKALEENFSGLEHQLKFFSDFDKIVIIIDFEENHSEEETPNPSIDIIRLKSDGRVDERVEVYHKDEKPFEESYDEIVKQWYLEINGERFDLHSAGGSPSTDIFRRMPVNRILYSELADRINNYFEKNGLTPSSEISIESIHW
ncbi:MAG: DUF4365 domain-containing protein [Candidatus Nanohaloarchaea archaeon]